MTTERTPNQKFMRRFLYSLTATFLLFIGFCTIGSGYYAIGAVSVAVAFAVIVLLIKV